MPCERMMTTPPRSMLPVCAAAHGRPNRGEAGAHLFDLRDRARLHEGLGIFLRSEEEGTHRGGIIKTGKVRPRGPRRVAPEGD